MKADGLKYILRKSFPGPDGSIASRSTSDRLSRGSLPGGSGISANRSSAKAHAFSKISRNNALDSLRGISDRGE